MAGALLARLYSPYLISRLTCCNLLMVTSGCGPGGQVEGASDDSDRGLVKEGVDRR